MTISSPKLTFEQFQAQYGEADRAYEFWAGEAREKGMPTIIHGLLQGIIIELLRRRGFIAASEVELRIDPEIHPRPDVIATRKLRAEKYPTSAWDVVVEIISEDDKLANVKDHCRRYQAWGFGAVYLVDPSDRSLSEWRNGALLPADDLAGVPTGEIWSALDRALAG